MDRVANKKIPPARMREQHMKFLSYRNGDENSVKKNLVLNNELIGIIPVIF